MIVSQRARRAAPLLLGLALFVLFFAATLDPSVQLYYRDTGRLYYPVKLFIAQQLRAGRLPLWDPMTECGVSLLGQVTPALLHPATLLYLVLPFDLAFKLNHMLGPLLAGIGGYRLSRRLGAGPWASLAGAIAYAGCGYVISVTGSNLPYAVGAGSVPIAIDAVLGFVEAPSVRRFAWAGAAVALIAYAGEPQAMLFAGLLSGAWALAIGGSMRGALRNLGLVACCGAIALAFSAPAVAPAFVELRRSDRLQPPDANLQGAFLNHPARLLGLLVPRAFDDAPESLEHNTSVSSTYGEYFTTMSSAFADSIVIGAPALLLAAAGFVALRRARLLVGGAVLLAMASTGAAFGIDRVLFAGLPLANAFRFAEKFVAPACLLIALAAALGAEVALAGSRRAALRLAAGALGLAGAAAALVLTIATRTPQAVALASTYGKTHTPALAEAFVRDLRAGLNECALLALALAAAALLRGIRHRPTIGLAPLCCAASVFASCGGLLYAAPVELLRGPWQLAQTLEAIAGPSPGRWRLFVNFQNPLKLAGPPPRVALMASMAQALFPQFNSIANIEGMSKYFSATDLDYLSAIVNAPEVYFNLFGVRFAVEMPHAVTERFARSHGFRRMGFGYWVREYPVFSRAFVVESARRVTTAQEALDAVTASGFDVRRSAVVSGDAAPDSVDGVASAASIERVGTDRLRVQAAGPGLLVVGEHYDRGWRASIGGKPVPVLKADLAALGVVLPPGPTTVDLRFVPVGFPSGVGVALGAAAVLLSAALIRRRSRLTKIVSEGHFAASTSAPTSDQPRDN